MLDSSTTVAMNTDIPLFGFKIHHPSSSCGMEAALVIQRPTPEESFFSWSDFPMVVEESPSYHTTSASFSSSSCDDDSSSLSPSSSPAASASSASLCSLASSSCSSSSSTTSLESTNANTVSRKRRQQTNSNYNNKNVRFSQHLQVRTYNLVLGEHPLCNDGLAIEMGWEYDSEQGENIDLQLHEDCKFRPGVQGYGGYYHPPSSQRKTRNYNNTFSCSRRSHLDRKRLLLEVAGCTTEELEDRTNTYQEEQQRLHKVQKQQYLANDI